VTKSLLVAFACTGIIPAPGLEEDESLGERIVAFCKANKGKQVGDGECAALAKAALKEVDAKPRSTYPDNPMRGTMCGASSSISAPRGESRLDDQPKPFDLVFARI